MKRNQLLVTWMSSWTEVIVYQWLVRINGLFHLLANGVVVGVITYNPLILTFDPNFLGHPSNQQFWINVESSSGPPVDLFERRITAL